MRPFWTKITFTNVVFQSVTTFKRPASYSLRKGKIWRQEPAVVLPTSVSGVCICINTLGTLEVANLGSVKH